MKRLKKIHAESIKETTDPLEDLFEFKAAEERDRARRANESRTANPEPEFKPWRVFINHIDGYHGEKLAELLSEREYVDPLSGMEKEDSKHKEYTRAENDDEEMLEEPTETEEMMIKNSNNGEQESSRKFSRKYEVIGTVMSKKYECPDYVTMIVETPTDDRSLFLSELLKCGIIVYDITQDRNQVEEARWVLKGIVKELEKIVEKNGRAEELKELRHFVLISTVMTWALTELWDQEDPVPFTEDDYQKRKPHPNFKKHMRCEKEVLMVKKNTRLKGSLKSLVLAAGLIYGDGEASLHYLFKMAWLKGTSLPVIGRGDNYIPLLHVRDLITIVSMVLEDWPKISYILAVEPEVITQSVIVQKISERLGTGKIKYVPKEEALLLEEINQETYDLMSINLNMDAKYIYERIPCWHLEKPFQFVTDRIIEEYKVARNLCPVKVVILGPPASGKTRVAQYLAEYYDISYIHVESLIKDTIDELTKEIKKIIENNASRDQELVEQQKIDSDEENNKIPTAEELQGQIDEIRNNLSQNNGRLEDSILNKLYLRRLKSKECKNQGYVIDGYPKTLEQVEELFEALEESSSDEEKDEKVVGNEILPREVEEKRIELGTTIAGVESSIVPELVVVLLGSDEFLIERIIQLPETSIQHTHYTEKHMTRRLLEYRERNQKNSTPLKFFMDSNIPILTISIEEDSCPDMFPTVYRCILRLGEPRNYASTSEISIEARKCAEEKIRAAEEDIKLQEQKQMEEMKEKRLQQEMQWDRMMKILKEEEEERVRIMSEPLKRYLAKYVLPILTKGLMEVAKLRPEDPVDFLAEYLFKENPEGRIFEPDYNETMKTLMNAIEEFQMDLFPEGELDEEMIRYLKVEKNNGNASDAYHQTCTTEGKFDGSIGKWTRRTQEVGGAVKSSLRSYEDYEELEFDEEDSEELPLTPPQLL